MPLTYSIAYGACGAALCWGSASAVPPAPGLQQAAMSIQMRLRLLTWRNDYTAPPPTHPSTHPPRPASRKKFFSCRRDWRHLLLHLDQRRGLPHQPGHRVHPRQEGARKPARRQVQERVHGEKRRRGKQFLFCSAVETAPFRPCSIATRGTALVFLDVPCDGGMVVLAGPLAGIGAVPYGVGAASGGGAEASAARSPPLAHPPLVFILKRAPAVPDVHAVPAVPAAAPCR